MTENRLADLLARIAIDPAFAEYTRLNPQPVADEYGLDAQSVAMLQSLSVTDAADGPAPLAERLSRSSLFFGGSLAAAGDVHHADAGSGDDGTDLAAGQASGKIAGRSLLDGGGKAGIIGPEGPADITGPGGLAEDDDGFRPIFHPPTGRIDDGVGIDGPGGPGGLDGKLDGLLGHGGPAGPGGIDVDGLLGHGGPGGPGGLDGLGGGPGGIDQGLGGPGGLDGKLGGLGGPGGPGGPGGIGGADGQGGAGPLGLDGPRGPGDFAGPGGFGDTGLAAGVTVTDVTVTPGGGGGDGQHHGSGTVTVHDDDGTTHVHDYGDDGFIERPQPVTGGDTAPHEGPHTGDTAEHERPSSDGTSGSGGEAHPVDPNDHGKAPVGSGEGTDPNRAPKGDGEGADPNRAPKGDGEGGDPNQAPGENGGGDANTGTFIAGSGPRTAPSSAGAVFVTPTGTEDPTGGAAAAQITDQSTP